MAHKLIAREMTNVEIACYRKYLNANWHIFIQVDDLGWSCLGAGTLLNIMKWCTPNALIDQIIWRLKDSTTQTVVCRLTTEQHRKLTIKFYAI